MGYVLALDAGTTSVRSLAVDEAGQVVEVARRPLTQHYPRPGWVEHDAAEIWDAAVGTLVEVAERLARRGGATASRPVALGLTNQRETVVAWDRRDGRPLHRAIVWQDRRTATRCEALQAAGHTPMIRATTGLVLDPYFSGTKMAWLLDQAGWRDPALLPHLALATVDTWLLWNLTGAVHGGEFATDVTNASRTLLFDIHRGAWSEELTDLLDVPRTLLPEVRPSCGRLGLVKAPGLTGTPLEGVPISGVAGDQHAALFGQACFEPGMAKVTYGTGSFALLCCGPRAPSPPDGLLVTPAWDLGGFGGAKGGVSFALEGSVFNSGSAIQWLRDGLELIEQADQVGPLAGSVPDAGGVYVIPAFTGLGSPWWDPRARGAVVGLTRGSTPAHLARAVVEAMAFQVRDMVEVMTRSSPKPLRAMRADGGAAVMDLLLQLQADQLQVPVSRPRSVETTALGAATLAGLAEGLWTDLAEIGRLWRPEVELRPSASQATADALYAPWLRALDTARNWAAD